MHKANRVISHLRQRTFLWRINRAWRKYQERKRLAWWQANHTQFSYKDISIQPGLGMRLFTDSHLGQEIFTGHFEPRERLFFNLFLRPGDIFIDVGANVGLFTLIAAQRVGEYGKIYAFDPHPLAAQRFLTNIKINHFTNVEFRPYALSDQAGYLDLNLDGDDSFSAVLPSKALKMEKVERVQAVCLDDFVRENQLFGKVALMKIDVEGWEEHILTGADEFLSRQDAPTLQVEFNEEAALCAGSSCQNIYSKLQELGFEIFRFNDQTRQLVPEERGQAYSYANLLATKQRDNVHKRSQNGRRPFWMR